MNPPASVQATPFETGGHLDRLARSIFQQLRELSFDGIGITRETYGLGEENALKAVQAVAAQEGLESTWDAARNLIVSLPGSNPDEACVICGSHLDSVPQGGNYDGAAGVIAGLLALVEMRRSGHRPRRTVKLYALRGEESAWYGRAYIGSSALFGQLSEEDLDLLHRDGKRTLRHAMGGVGADLAAIRPGKPLLTSGEVAAFYELHIEQGPVLVARNLPTAIVTGIRGNFRHKRVTCQGEAGHSGTVPRWLRRDAVFAICDLTSRLDEHWRILQERGHDLVVTIGMIGTNPGEHAISRIPGDAWFSFEVRSQSEETLAAFYDLVRAECQSIAQRRNVAFSFDRRIDSKPALMDERLIDRLKSHATGLGLPVDTIPSGAGHDAAMFANAGIPSAMIFIRNAHGSHNPAEAMAYDDFMKGANLLYRALCDDD